MAAYINRDLIILEANETINVKYGYFYKSKMFHAMKKIWRFILKIISWFFLIPIYIYKYAISPLTPASCRHVPTCSEYGVQAIKIHGPFKGIWLTAKRISRCNPWGTHGYDPVPPKKQIKTEILKTEN